MLNRRSFFSRIAAAVVGAPLVAKALTARAPAPELLRRYADLYVRNQVTKSSPLYGIAPFEHICRIAE